MIKMVLAALIILILTIAAILWYKRASEMELEKLLNVLSFLPGAVLITLFVITFIIGVF